MEEANLLLSGGECGKTLLVQRRAQKWSMNTFSPADCRANKIKKTSLETMPYCTVHA
jgi:hypothetical protein